MAVIFCCALPALAQLDRTPNRHVVVLVDVDPASTYQYLLDDNSSLPNTLTKFLQKQNLYNEGDYLTIATYSLNLADVGGRNFDTFVTIPADRNGDAILWTQPSINNPFRGMSARWNSITRGQHISKQPYGSARGSLNSMHLFYALRAIAALNDEQGANRLTILTISEDLHQANDNIAGDLRSLYQIDNCRIAPKDRDRLTSESEQFSRDVKQKFAFTTQHKSKILASGFTSKGISYPFQIAKTEVKVAREPSIQNILHLPALPELRRVRGGYRLRIPSPEMDEDFKLEKMELVLETKKGTRTYTADGDEDLKVTIPRDEVSGSHPRATLKAWVRFNDGLYNGLVLNPYDEENHGLSMSQELRAYEEPKIYGFLGVNDAFWLPFMPEDYDNTVMIYTGIVTILALAVLAAIIMYLIRKLSAYSPSSRDITIRPVSGKIVKK